MMDPVRGRIASGHVVFDGPAPWPEGQAVVVLAVSAEDLERPAAPTELIDEVAAELATRDGARRGAMEGID